jgi:hypothetical protein
MVAKFNDSVMFALFHYLIENSRLMPQQLGRLRVRAEFESGPNPMRFVIAGEPNLPKASNAKQFH